MNINPTERKRLQAELRQLVVLQGLHNERINQIREALNEIPVSKGLSEKERLALITSRRKRAYSERPLQCPTSKPLSKP